MGYWFNEFDNCTTWRKTPVKIGNKWYTPKGEKIVNPAAYFSKVKQNGRYWDNNTGWRKSNKYCSGSGTNYSNNAQWNNLEYEKYDRGWDDHDDEKYYREMYYSHDHKDDDSIFDYYGDNWDNDNEYD